MDLDCICTAIDQALTVSVGGIQSPGIVGAAVRSAAISSEELQRVATHLERQGHTEIRLSAEVELFLRISNTDVLSSIESTVFSVSLGAEENDLRAVARNENNWGAAWERAIEPIKQAALQSMRDDIRNMDENLTEDSYTFQAAMVLLASELVGPYVDRITTFLGYPPGLVQVMAGRLFEAKVWEGDEVRCERWFDPQKGAMDFMLDLMVAKGNLIRKWSEEEKQYAYCAVSHFAV